MFIKVQLKIVKNDVADGTLIGSEITVFGAEFAANTGTKSFSRSERLFSTLRRDH